MYTNDDFFRVIGRISVTFATWDIFVSDVIVRLRPGKPPLFNETDTRGRKLRLLERLKPEDVCDSHLLAGLVVHLPEATSIADERNRYIHDQWLFDKDLIARGRIRRYRFVFEAEIRAESKELTIRDLESFSRTLLGIQKPFSDAAHKLHPGFFLVSDA